MRSLDRELVKLLDFKIISIFLKDPVGYMLKYEIYIYSEMGMCDIIYFHLLSETEQRE